MPYLFTDYNAMVGKKPRQAYWKELQDALNNLEGRIITQAERDKLASLSSMTPAEIKTAYESNLDTNAFTDAEKTKLGGVEPGANRYVHPLTHPPEIIVQDSGNRFVSDTEKARWNDTYTKLDVDNALNSVITGLDWKESVATFADIATTYPSPEDGWTVNVKDTDYTYRYDAFTAKWIAISANAIPLATQTVDGKMSKQDKTKLDGIEEGANKYILPVATTMLGGVKSGGDIIVDANGVVSIVDDSHNHVIANVDGLQTALDGKSNVGHTHLIGEVQNLQTALDNKSNVGHTHAISEIPNLQTTLDSHQSQINTKADAGHTHPLATQTSDGLMSAADKAHLDNMVASGTTNQNAWSHITIALATPVTISADEVTDTITFYPGDGMILTPDSANDRIDFSVKLTPTSHGELGGGNLHAYASTTTAGFMAPADKSKLDSVEQGAINQSTADARYFQKTNNLSEVSNKDTARKNLGITVSKLAPSAPSGGDIWVDLN